MDGQASQQVEKDFDTLLEYAGMTRSQWAAADISGRRKAHEHLAEAFESYIMEGKAPNEQLRNAFRRFADWLKSVYKAIRRNSNSLPLTDEVRGVFDRMLAAEEDIQQEKRLNGYFEHLPKVITDSMSDATKARVEAFIDKARDKAVELLTKDAMSIYKEDQKEAIKDYRAEIIPEVEKEVGELRVYKSGYTHADVKKYENLWAIVTGTDEVGRELTPEEEAWMMQADLMAESLDYSSTDEMLQDVMKAPTFKQAVTKRVSERVNEKFLDVMADIRAHEEAVRRAIYNDDAGLLIGVEQQLIEEYAEKAMDAQSEKEATAKAKPEAWTSEKIFKTLPVGSSLSYAARELAERVVTEGVTEFVQEYPDAITRIWAKNAEKDAGEIADIVADNIGDITSDAVYSCLIGSILGGGLGGANISMQMALGDSFQRAAERGVHESKLGILERQIGNFAEQGTDADVAGAVVDASSNDARVYVDGEALTAYAQTSAELNNLALSLGVDVEAIKKLPIMAAVWQ